MKLQDLMAKLLSTNNDFPTASIPVKDIISLLETLEVETSIDIESMVNDIAKEITSKLDYKDVVDDFDIDTDVRNKTVEISISSLTFNRYEIESIVEDAIETVVTKSKSEVYN